jgi:hypothetical protein
MDGLSDILFRNGESQARVGRAAFSTQHREILIGNFAGLFKDELKIRWL